MILGQPNHQFSSRSRGYDINSVLKYKRYWNHPTGESFLQRQTNQFWVSRNTPSDVILIRHCGMWN